MKDKVNVRLLCVIGGFISPDKAKAIGMDIEDSVKYVEEYTLHYAVYEDKYEDGIRVEVTAYHDDIGGYYLHDSVVHGDFDPGDDQIAKDLIAGIFAREKEYEIWCEDPILVSTATA